MKLLYNLKQTVDDEQFIREFKNLMMLKHPNIVRLVGYCYETQRQHADFEGTIVFAETTKLGYLPKYMTTFRFVVGLIKALKSISLTMERHHSQKERRPSL